MKTESINEEKAQNKKTTDKEIDTIIREAEYERVVEIQKNDKKSYEPFKSFEEYQKWIEFYDGVFYFLLESANIFLWLKRSYWTPEQAVALFFLKDPDYIEINLAKSSANKFKSEYYNVLNIIKTHCKGDNLTPQKYAEIADEYEIFYHPELKKYFKKSFDNDYKVLKRRIAELEEENQKLTCKVKELNLNPKRAETLYKMIMSVALLTFKYVPNKNNNATSSFQKKINQIGLEISDDGNPIRDALADGYAKFKKEIDEYLKNLE